MLWMINNVIDCSHDVLLILIRSPCNTFWLKPFVDHIHHTSHLTIFKSGPWQSTQARLAPSNGSPRKSVMASSTLMTDAGAFLSLPHSAQTLEGANQAMLSRTITTLPFAMNTGILPPTSSLLSIHHLSLLGLSLKLCSVRLSLKLSPQYQHQVGSTHWCVVIQHGRGLGLSSLRPSLMAMPPRIDLVSEPGK